jgi:pyruvate dehydrogenase E1 component
VSAQPKPELPERVETERHQPTASPVRDPIPSDSDPQETREWLDAFEDVVRNEPERGLFLLRQLEQYSKERGLLAVAPAYSAYRNTIPLERQGVYPGDLLLEERITAIMRWNALVMVARANADHGELGGHIASYASAAEIFETGFNHFFRGSGSEHGADLIFLQPHSAPGVYARAFLEGRLTEEQLLHFRRETTGRGLSSYPHPWLMPEFWQFPTGSMGLGPITAIYQARFMRYLEHRGLLDTRGRRVWGVFGDGEMDEPESIAGLTLAARETLDNLVFVVNCNLQRLDGPVRGNGQVIQELESLFAGAGWNVIKVLWGSDWDALFARDKSNVLLRRLAATVDGEYQTLGAKDGSYNVEHFFKKDPEIEALVSHMSDAEIDSLKRGGHDYRKLHAAFTAARAHRGRPTVILAKTKKGYGMGGAGESRMTAHQAKKLDFAGLSRFRDRFHLPLTDADLEALRFYRPGEDSAELRYLRERRAALGGSLPARRADAHAVAVPATASYARFALEAAGKEMSTTMAFVRMLASLLRDPTLGPRIVPIVADEARTFGMANLFQQIGIYSPVGQRYDPEDAGSLVSYREARDGQLLEEGITEAGALSSWIAAGTAYSVHGLAMLPFYLFYSVFGFQRVADLIWAAADQRTRGFLIGATSGRTTLSGEGLQHQDGSSHIFAATVPSCRAYDPTFACELAVILEHGMRELMERQVDCFYYVTVLNESYPQPSLPEGAADGVIRGMYRLASHVPEAAAQARVSLLGSGAILREVIAGGQLLANDWCIQSDVYSVTSFALLASDAAEVERHNRLHPAEVPRQSYLELQLGAAELTVAATDYVRAYPQLIAPHVPGRYVTLGTDGFGRSDTRLPLRRFFEVDRWSIVLTALASLAQLGKVPATLAVEALERYGIDPSTRAPWTL